MQLQVKLFSFLTSSSSVNRNYTRDTITWSTFTANILSGYSLNEHQLNYLTNHPVSVALCSKADMFAAPVDTSRQTLCFIL